MAFELASTMKVLRPYSNIWAFYDGRIPGVRAHSPRPAWLDDRAFTLGCCSFTIVEGDEAVSTTRRCRSPCPHHPPNAGRGRRPAHAGGAEPLARRLHCRQRGVRRLRNHRQRADCPGDGRQPDLPRGERSADQAGDHAQHGLFAGSDALGPAERIAAGGCDRAFIAATTLYVERLLRLSDESQLVELGLAEFADQALARGGVDYLLPMSLCTGTVSRRCWPWRSRRTKTDRSVSYASSAAAMASRGANVPVSRDSTIVRKTSATAGEAARMTSSWVAPTTTTFRLGKKRAQNSLSA